MIDSREAANLFIDILFHRAYQGVYNYIEKDLLPEGLPGRADDPVEMEEWYRNLGEKDQEHIKEIIQIMIKETICSFLAIFDNRVGSPIKGQKSEFVICIQTYQNPEDVPKNLPKESVRLNLLNTRGYDELESLFISRIREQNNQL
jgi:hypothetical protein